jgi:Undecaprenyl-phosphate glucose phosphotransferase
MNAEIRHKNKRLEIACMSSAHVSNAAASERPTIWKLPPHWRRHLPCVAGAASRASDTAAMLIGGLVGGTAIDHGAAPLTPYILAPILVIFWLLLPTEADFDARGETGLGRRLWMIVSSWLGAVGLVMAAVFVVGAGVDRHLLLSFLGTSLTLLLAMRMSLEAYFRRLAQFGLFAARTAVVGAGDIGANFIRSLSSASGRRFAIQGVFDDRRSRFAIAPAAGVPILGDIAMLASQVKSGEFDSVVIALPWSAEARIASIADRFAGMVVDICLAPDLQASRYLQRPLSTLSDLPIVPIRNRPLAGWAAISKRLEDIVAAAIGLLLFAPLMAVIAVMIKLDSPGPVLFTQRRYGLNGNLITVQKFRTMFHDMRDADGHVQTTRQDPRVTRVGAVLRRFSLDELPQLVDVLRGEMSVVGPRPHAIATKAAGWRFEDAVKNYTSRHRVKPGMTGWAQVNGFRGEMDTLEKIRNRVALDLYYIENWSLAFDLEILVKTVKIVICGPGAY